MTTITPPPVQPDYQGEPYQPPVSQPPKKSRKLAALIGTVALVAGAGIAGALAGGNHSPAPAAAVSVPAAAQRAAGTPATDAQQQYDTWFSGTGSTDLTAVYGDMSSLQADAAGQDLPATETDGASLAADAQAAADGPPPVDAADYSTALGDWAQAGTDYAAGDIADGTTSLEAGTAAFQAWESALTSAGVKYGSSS